MRRAILGTLLLSLVGLLTVRLGAQQPSPPQQQTPPPPPAVSGQQSDQGTVRKTVELVDIIFSVLNRRQKFVTELQKEDFRVLEDGKPQDIRFFSRQTDLPLRVGLLMDTSNSIRERLKFEQEAAVEFLYNVVRRKKDRAFLMTFDDEPEVIQDYTDDSGLLRDGIMKQRAGGGTALNDAIYFACDKRLLNPPLPSPTAPDVRRILVVISDGDDTLSTHSRAEAIEVAQRAGVMIYTISTSTQWVTAEEESDPNKRVARKYHMDPGDLALQKLADETGGRAYFPYRVDDLGASFQDIGDELRSQYSLAYTPQNQTADGRFRKIQIQFERKELKDLSIRARKGYYAPHGSADTPSSSPRTPQQ
jgi:Ca-activated chloride channel family protein